MDLMVEVSPRRVFANAHTYHVNSISVNSDYETYMSADDLRINLWHLDITDRSFSILFGDGASRPSRRGALIKILIGLASIQLQLSVRAQQSVPYSTCADNKPILVYLNCENTMLGEGNIIPEERKCGLMNNSKAA